MNIDPPSPYNTSLTGQFLWQVSRSREWAHPVGKVVFNSMEDGGCCCGVVGWTNAKAGAAAASSRPRRRPSWHADRPLPAAALDAALLDYNIFNCCLLRDVLAAAAQGCMYGAVLVLAVLV